MARNAAVARVQNGELPFPRGLRLARPLRAEHGPDKYRILALRRRRAQIRARRVLELT